MRFPIRWLLYSVGALLVVCLVFRFGGPASAFAKAHRSLGRQAYAQGRYADAAHEFRIASLLGFSHERERAAALFHLGELEKAEHILRREGDSPGAIVTLGVVLMAQDRDTEAEQAYQSVLNRQTGRSHGDKALAEYNLSILYRKRGDKVEAKQAHQGAVEWSKGDVATWSGPQPIYPYPSSTPR